MSLRDLLPQHRILLTRLLFVPLLTYIVFTISPWDTEGYFDLAIETAGYMCLVVATLGRVWCLSYIGGYKDGELIAAGPYSVVRNPLYVFNFIGGVGFGLATEHPETVLVIALAFFVYYPLVVRREERRLDQRHGAAFRAYAQNTPRWIPDFSRFVEPSVYEVRPRFIRRSLLGSMWFLWLFLAWEIVEKLHVLEAIPVYRWWRGRPDGYCLYQRVRSALSTLRA